MYYYYHYQRERQRNRQTARERKREKKKQKVTYSKDGQNGRLEDLDCNSCCFIHVVPSQTEEDTVNIKQGNIILYRPHNEAIIVISQFIVAVLA